MPGGPFWAPAVSPLSSAGTGAPSEASEKKTFSMSSAWRSHRSTASPSQWAAAPLGAGTRTFARIMTAPPVNSEQLDV
jgi:hypothetical protein